MSLSTSLLLCLFLPRTLLFFLSLSVVMDHNIVIAVGCACTINDVASWVRTTVSASTDPSGSNQGESKRPIYQMFQYYLNLNFLVVLTLTMAIEKRDQRATRNSSIMTTVLVGWHALTCQYRSYASHCFLSNIIRFASVITTVQILLLPSLSTCLV